MNFIWLDDFVALAHTGDFFLAARERKIPVNVFSRRIRRLEEWVGADLVDRSFKSTTLTSTGERFVSVARDLIARAAQLSQEAREAVGEGDGILKLACTPTLFLSFLPDWLTSLGRVALTPMLRFSDSQAQCEAMLQHGMVQFAVIYSHLQERSVLHGESFKSAVIGHDELIPVSVPTVEGLPLFTLGVSDRKVEVLSYATESGLGRIHATVFGRQLAGMNIHVQDTASTTSVLRRMTLAGKGLAWIPRNTVQDDLSSGTLVLAGEDKWNVPLEVCIYRAWQPLPATAEAFWDTISVS